MFSTLFVMSCMSRMAVASPQIASQANIWQGLDLEKVENQSNTPERNNAILESGGETPVTQFITGIIIILGMIHYDQNSLCRTWHYRGTPTTIQLYLS